MKEIVIAIENLDIWQEISRIRELSDKEEGLCIGIIVISRII